MVEDISIILFVTLLFYQLGSNEDNKRKAAEENESCPLSRERFWILKAYKVGKK